MMEIISSLRFLLFEYGIVPNINVIGHRKNINVYLFFMDHTISYSFCYEGIGLQFLRFLLVFVVSTNLSRCHFLCTYMHTHINTHMTVLTFWSTDDQSWSKEIWDTTASHVLLFESGYVFYVFGYHMVAFDLWTYDV